ncbi:MAG: hypothetical protein L0H83_15065, partial [Salinisphaera sp.]|nr:hypothetical protein [Salinisphaera sp.]
MPQSTRIDGEMIQAYLDTAYRAFGKPPLSLRIGETDAVLVSMHRRLRWTPSVGQPTAILKWHTA